MIMSAMWEKQSPCNLRRWALALARLLEKYRTKRQRGAGLERKHSKVAVPFLGEASLAQCRHMTVCGMLQNTVSDAAS